MTDEHDPQSRADLKKAADDILKKAKQDAMDGIAAEADDQAIADGEAPGGNDETSLPERDAQMDDMRDKLMRALADAENTRRRAERDKEDAYKYANTRFARDLLSVADNFNRALESVDSEAKESGGQALQNVLDGIAITERELLAVFEKHGIKKVSPEQGEKFDPNLHQAMAEVPGTGQPNGTVFQVTQPGYTIEDRLLRPAMVLVAKGEG